MSLRIIPAVSRAALAVLFGSVIALLALPSAAVSVGSTPSGGGGFTWGAGIGGGNCTDVIAKMRSNWLDVRRIVAPKTTTMRPRRRDFYCISPAYIEHAMQKVVPMTTGLKCFEIQDRGFCCDTRYQQCATM